MYKRWVKSFNEKEAKDREKYGQRVFLEKYINRYKSYKSTMKWLFPMVLLVHLALVFIYFSNYISHNRMADLVITILWSIASVLYLIINIGNFTFYFNFIEEKVDAWKKELESLDN